MNAFYWREALEQERLSKQKPTRRRTRPQVQDLERRVLQLRKAGWGISKLARHCDIGHQYACQILRKYRKVEV